MKVIFVTGSGTNIGKTIITGGLVKSLRESGKKAKAIKPVISGYDDNEDKNNDLKILAYANGNEADQRELAKYVYSQPLSIDVISRKYGGEFCYNTLLEFISSHEGYDYLLIEGAGGVLSPLDERHTNLDLMRSLGTEVIYVCGSYLGSVSHGLSGYYALKNTGIDIKTLIINQTLEPDNVLYTEQDETIKSFRNFIDENLIAIQNLKGDYKSKIDQASEELKMLWSI